MSSIIVINIFMVALVGAILAATPYLMPPTECFTVTVPPSAKRDPRVRALYRNYAMGVGALTLVDVAITVFTLPKANDLTASLIVMGVVLAPMAASFALMLHNRKQVQALKQTQGWTATGAHAAAIVGDGDLPQPVPLAWELLHLVVVAMLMALIAVVYDRLPAQVPMHADLGGSVTEYAAKSPRVALFPVLEAAFLGIVFAFCHWGILRSKRPVDPAAPATSALAYAQFARIQSLIMLVGGLALNTCSAAAFLLSWLGVVTLEFSGVFVVAVGLIFVAAEIWVSVRLGQSGGRVAAEMRTNDGVARDDDHLYKLGVFYVNPEDPSVWVPKRFGMGWTLNYARPLSWLLMALLVLISAGFAFAAFLLTK